MASTIDGQTSDVSETIASKAFRDSKDVVFYLPNVDHKLTPETRTLLETYSHVPPDEISAHVHAIRDRAWAIRSYPCVGLGVFLSSTIQISSAYSEILIRLKAGDSLVDIGAFIGQDLRRLVFDGAPSINLYAVDIVSFWDVGYSMFRDQDRFSAKFIASDLLKPNEEMRALRGKMDVVCITQLFHQWAWDIQDRALKKVVELSRPGTIVTGFQVGMLKGSYVNPLPGVEGWLHDPETWSRMWEKAGKETRTTWKVEAELVEWDVLGPEMAKVAAYMGRDARPLMFVVRRVDDGGRLAS